MMAKKKTQTPADRLAAALIPKEAQPYEIPANWRWVKLKTVAEILNGFAFKSKQYTLDGIRIIRISNVQDGYIEDKKPVYYPLESEEAIKPFLLEEGDLLMSLTGNIGRVGILQKEFLPAALNQRVACLRFRRNDENSKKFYFYYFQQKTFIDACVKNAKGTAQLNMSTIWLGNYQIPLPPLAEQARIVARIETLFAQLDEAEEKLRAAEGTFAARRAAILQSALRGKLISHSNTGENAESLYQAIQKKKEELIADKKLKREKPLSPIADKEKPFEIPSNWKWVRLGDIFNLQAGKNITSADIVDEKDNEHPYACYGGNGLRGYVATYNREGSYALIGRQGAYCGNVQFAVGKFYATEHAVVVDTFEMTNVEWSRLFLSALNLNQYSTATAQPGLAVSKIVNCLIPLPPLDEQREIVRLLDDAFAEEERARQALEAARAAIPALRRAILARAFRGALGTGDPAEPPADLSAAR